LAECNGPYVSYEASLFPGAVLRVSNPKVVFLLFRSGKIVITGEFFFILLLYLYCFLTDNLNSPQARVL
jgi:hypothetical protein